MPPPDDVDATYLGAWYPLAAGILGMEPTMWCGMTK